MDRLLINCDMGEWDANHIPAMDHLIMPYIDLCNIACGGHAGSTVIMKYTIALAKKYNKQIGCHPGYNDRKNFGRQYVKLSKKELDQLLGEQIGNFSAICKSMDCFLHHIKPHGALYHACNHEEMESEVLVSYLQKNYPCSVVLCMPESILHHRLIQADIPYMTESFLDRAYTDELKLISRVHIDATIIEPHEAVSQYALLDQGKIRTQSGNLHSISSHTACIHGDNPSVVQILKAISEYTKTPKNTP